MRNRPASTAGVCSTSEAAVAELVALSSHTQTSGQLGFPVSIHLHWSCARATRGKTRRVLVIAASSRRRVTTRSRDATHLEHTHCRYLSSVEGGVVEALQSLIATGLLTHSGRQIAHCEEQRPVKFRQAAGYSSQRKRTLQHRGGSGAVSSFIRFLLGPIPLDRERHKRSYTIPPMGIQPDCKLFSCKVQSTARSAYFELVNARIISISLCLYGVPSG